MVRTQIQLEERQAKRLHALAARRGVSMAECVRDSVEQYLVNAEAGGTAERIRQSLAVCGKFRSGRRDVSARHDDYLAETFGG
jgi:hypothetical protein